MKTKFPRLWTITRSAFILFNCFDYSDGKLSIGEIDLFIGANFLVTVSQPNSENRQLSWKCTCQF